MQLLIFLLNGVRFGIMVNDIESIETKLDIVEIPNSLPQIRGIMNLHGEMVAVYSLAEEFHYPKQEINNMIVVRVGNTKLALEVGSVQGIIDVAEGQVVRLPDIMQSEDNYFDITTYDKQLIVYLEMSKLISRQEQDAIQNIRAHG